MRGREGYFNDLLFTSNGAGIGCRLNMDKPNDIEMTASDAAAMLTTHMRQVNMVLSDVCEETPIGIDQQTISSLAWTMHELGGLLEGLRSIESEARRAAQDEKAATAAERQEA